MVYPKDDKVAKKRVEGIAASFAKDPVPWNKYDDTIKSVLADYTAFLGATTSYTEPDWHLIKAMLWVECGADNSQWLTKPMQIGVKGDTGLPDLLPVNDHSKLILPPAYVSVLTTDNVKTNPTYNIMAGIGLLLKHAAKIDYRTVMTPAFPQSAVQVAPISSPQLPFFTEYMGIGAFPFYGQSGVSINSSFSMIPTVGMSSALLPPEFLAHPAHKADPTHPAHDAKPKKQLAVYDWRTIDATTIKDLYNGKNTKTKLVGNQNYQAEVEGCLKIINTPAIPGFHPPMNPNFVGPQR